MELKLDSAKNRDAIKLHSGVRFRARVPTIMESPVNIGKGNYEIENIGAFTYLGDGDTSMRQIGSIGRFCSIAPDLTAGLVEHPTNFLSTHPIFVGGGSKRFDRPELSEYWTNNASMITHAQETWNRSERAQKIIIGNDVWIGRGVLISRGVSIGDGAIIAARAVVTKDVPPYAVVGGIPARILKYRLPEHVIEKLIECAWTRYGLPALDGVDMTDPEKGVLRIEANIAKGIPEYRPKKYSFIADKTGVVSQGSPISQ